jgi:hypothetical protein
MNPPVELVGISVPEGWVGVEAFHSFFTLGL